MKIIQKLEPLFFNLAEQAYKILKIKGQLVLVTPYIVSRSGQSVTMPIDEKLEKTGFKKVYPFSKEMFSEKSARFQDLLNLSSLVEIDERHKIGREIHVFQK